MVSIFFKTAFVVFESCLICVQISAQISEVLWGGSGLCPHQTPFFLWLWRSLVSTFLLIFSPLHMPFYFLMKNCLLTFNQTDMSLQNHPTSTPFFSFPPWPYCFFSSIFFIRFLFLFFLYLINKLQLSQIYKCSGTRNVFHVKLLLFHSVLWESINIWKWLQKELPNQEIQCDIDLWSSSHLVL